MEELFKTLITGGNFSRKGTGHPIDQGQQEASINRSNHRKKSLSAPKTLDFFNSTNHKRQRDFTRSNKKPDNTPKEGQKKVKRKRRKKKSKNSVTKTSVKAEMNKEEEEEEDALALFPGHASKSIEDSMTAEQQKEEMTRQEMVRAFRRRMQIHISGSDVPDPIESFEDLPTQGPQDEVMKRALLQNIEESDWKEPTPIQMQAIPTMIKSRDVLASAPTGSGKTAAFVIPLLAKLKAPHKQGGIRGLLLAPTRELASQIQREVLRLSEGRKFRVCLLGKSNAATATADGSKNALSHFDILVSTPMRLVAVLQNKCIDLSKVQVVVLDEVDKLFERNKAGKEDLSFISQVDEVLGACTHAHLQRGLFSATVDSRVQELADSVLVDQVTIWVGQKNAGADTIKQELVFVGREEGKLLAIRQIVQKGIRPPVLIFLQSKDRAKELFRELIYDGINVDVIHADRTQEQRDSIIKRFRIGDIWVLICTDLMSRGIDFKGVNLVINYDFPQSAVSYIHRIGRTGRAGRKGEAITLFTEDDIEYLRSIANVMKISGCDVPEWMLSIKKVSSKEKKRMEHSAPKRKRVSTVSGYDLKKKNKKRMVIAQTKKQIQGP